MKTLKLVLISETFPPDLCGVADYVLTIAKELSGDYEVHILTRKLNSPNHYNIDKISVHEIMSSKFYIFQIINFLKKINPDIIDVQLSYSSSSKLHKKNIFSLCNSFLLKLIFKKTKLFCTIHELTSFLETNSLPLSTYRKIRDYFHTRFYDHYFCVDKRYLNYFKTHNQTFLPHFSNIPTLIKKKTISSPTLLYFGTISEIKKIDKLIKLIDEISDQIPDIKLLLIGGIIDSYNPEFYNLISKSSSERISYLGFLDEHKVMQVIRECSYAIFPFQIFDKNSSILAMLVNGLIVMAETDQDLEIIKHFSNFYGTKELTKEFIVNVLDSTLKSEIESYDNNCLIAENISQRIKIYESFFNS